MLSTNRRDAASAAPLRTKQGVYAPISFFWQNAECDAFSANEIWSQTDKAAIGTIVSKANRCADGAANRSEGAIGRPITEAPGPGGSAIADARRSLFNFRGAASCVPTFPVNAFRHSQVLRMSLSYFRSWYLPF